MEVPHKTENFILYIKNKNEVHYLDLETALWMKVIMKIISLSTET